MTADNALTWNEWSLAFESDYDRKPRMQEMWEAAIQTGRDQLQKELAEQEPVGYVREWEGDVSDLGNTIFETDKNECDDNPNWVALIPQPTMPEK